MADFPTHDSPERRKPLTGRQKAAQRDTARKARQAERHVAKRRLEYNTKRGNTDDE